MASIGKGMEEATEAADLATQAIIEGTRVLKKLGYPILPKKFLLL